LRFLFRASSEKLILVNSYHLGDSFISDAPFPPLLLGDGAIIAIIKIIEAMKPSNIVNRGLQKSDIKLLAQNQK
jgi:hypothetical protein